jgi:hypothetical protein
MAFHQDIQGRLVEKHCHRNHAKRINILKNDISDQSLISKYINFVNRSFSTKKQIVWTPGDHLLKKQAKAQPYQLLHYRPLQLMLLS